MSTASELRARLDSSQAALTNYEQNKNEAKERLNLALDAKKSFQAEYDAARAAYDNTLVNGGGLVDSQGNPIETEETRAARQRLVEASSNLSPYNNAVENAQIEYDTAQAEYDEQAQQNEELEAGLSDAIDREAAEAADIAAEFQLQSEDPTATVKSPENTTKSLSDQESLDKMNNAEIIGEDPTIQRFDDGSSIQTFDDGSSLVTTDDGTVYATESPGESNIGVGRELSVPKGAQPAAPTPANVQFKSATGGKVTKDLRVKIRVPGDYLVSLTRGSKERDELYKLGGIIFPYTPQISVENKADYANSNPMHSNFNLYFYQRSSVTAIQITGKFTVQNDIDAAVLISTQHLLRALTKMRTGNDADSGAPPPICRLDAYGDFGLSNIPVAVSSFRMEYPEGVDYYTIGKKTTSKFGVTSVPVSCSITVSLLPMYSRDEMLKFSVTGWLSDSNVKKSGIL